MKPIPSRVLGGRAGRARARGLLGACLACAAAAAAARPLPDLSAAPEPLSAGDPPGAFATQGGSISLAQAMAMAQRRYKGRVVRAQSVKQGGHTIYVIRILGEDGRVMTVRIDAETGAFL